MMCCRWLVSGPMRSVLVVVLFSIVPAYADTPPQPRPQPDSKAAPAPDSKAAPAPDSKAAPAPDSKTAPAPKSAPAPGSGPAPAQGSAPAGPPRTLPPASLADVMPKTAPNGPDQATGGPSFGGGVSAGIVIRPEPHPDDRPWPQGMVITPPDVNDAIAIAPGTDSLAPGKPPKPEPWNKRIGDAVQDGIEAIVDLVLPRKL